MNPSPPRERNSPDRPPQSSGGPPARPEELTRGVEIPGKPGGFASTRRPGRTGLRRDTPPGVLSQVDHRYKARTAWIAGFRQSSSAPSGKALCVPRSPRLVVRGRAAKRVSDAVDDVGPRVEGPEVRREARTGQCEGDGNRRTTGNAIRGAVDRSRNVGRSGSARSALLKRFLEKVPADGPLRERHRHWRTRTGNSAWEVPRARGTASSEPQGSWRAGGDVRGKLRLDSPGRLVNVP